MNKYKVCVYAIAKNESQFVDRWVDSMQEADKIFVLDTGSTDDTVEKLKNRGVVVQVKQFNPWRFDAARNASLALVDDDCDICVCTDLDEVFTPGWREELEKSWTPETNLLAYNYIWNFDEQGNPGTSFYIQKIHAPKLYSWVNPVHEVLKINEGHNVYLTYCSTITLNHYPDKEKSRSSYLPLLELSVKENPQNDRNVHYLGREYMFYQRWQESIDTLHYHLTLSSATWADERAASMRYMARCYLSLNRPEEAIMWYEKAIQEAPYLREAYTELGIYYYHVNNFPQSINYLEKALAIKEKPKTYICESYSYNETIYDVLSIDYYNLQDYYKAYAFAGIALAINPHSARIKANQDIFLKKLQSIV